MNTRLRRLHRYFEQMMSPHPGHLQKKTSPAPPKTSERRSENTTHQPKRTPTSITPSRQGGEKTMYSYSQSEAKPFKRQPQRRPRPSQRHPKNLTKPKAILKRALRHQEASKFSLPPYGPGKWHAKAAKTPKKQPRTLCVYCEGELYPSIWGSFSGWGKIPVFPHPVLATF